MFLDEDIDRIREQLFKLGKTAVPLKVGPHEGRLFLQKRSTWDPCPDINAPEVLLIAHESGGCSLYSGKAPLNTFTLISSGFNLHIAAVICTLLNRLFHFDKLALSPQTETKPNNTTKRNATSIQRSSNTSTRPRSASGKFIRVSDDGGRH